MKKRMLTLLLTVLVISSLAIPPAFAVDNWYSYLKIVSITIGKKVATVNNTTVKLDQAAYIKSGRTLIPFRFLGESLGAKITWDQTKKQAGLTLGDKNVKVTIGSKTAYVNSQKVTLDVPAELKQGRTFIPLRFVSENLGAEVDWDSDTSTVTVQTIDTTGWKQLNYSDNTLAARYPAGWNVSLQQNDSILTLTNSRGTEAYAYLTDRNVDQLTTLKLSAAQEAGFVLDYKDYYDPNDHDKGMFLSFHKDDPQNPNNSLINYVFAYKLDDPAQTWQVFDETMKANYIDQEDPIIWKIIYPD